MEPTMTTRAEQWTPPTGRATVAVPAGTWWDAVRVTDRIGERALAILGTESGSVIEDSSSTLYWLVPCGSTAASWKLRDVHVLTAAEGVTTYLCVPPENRLTRPGSYWRMPFTRARYLTDPWLLFGGLRVATRAGRRGAGPPGCGPCGCPAAGGARTRGRGRG